MLAKDAWFWKEKKMNSYDDSLGNVLNGTIGKQMVDTLVESTSNVEVLSFTLCVLSWSLSAFFIFLKSPLSCPVIFDIRIKSVKNECLQLILNYFKLFLLLPGEEVRNLRAFYILWQPKTQSFLWQPKTFITCITPKAHISCVDQKHVLIRKSFYEHLARYMYVSPKSPAIYIAKNQSDPFVKFGHGLHPMGKLFEV